MSQHFQLNRKMPLIGGDSLSREQRENPGIVLEWIEQEQGVGPPGQRQSRQRAKKSSWSEQDQELE